MNNTQKIIEVKSHIDWYERYLDGKKDMQLFESAPIYIISKDGTDYSFDETLELLKKELEYLVNKNLGN